MRTQYYSVKICLAWLTVTCLYAYQYILRIAPSVMTTHIMQKYHITAADLGYFAALYYIGYAVMHLPFGMLYDRFGVRIIVSLSVVMIIIGQFPLIYSNSWTMVLLGRFLIGAGSSGAILAVFKIIRNYFPAHLFPRLLSLSVTIGLIGALGGGYPLQKLLLQYDWQIVQLCIISLAILLIIIGLATIPDDEKKINNALSFNYLLNRQTLIPILLTAVIGGLMVGPMEGFADIWGPNFLVKIYKLSPSLSAFLPSLIFIGMAVGAPLMGIWIEKSQRYDNILKICAFVMLILFSGLIYLNITPFALYGLFFITGLMCSYQILIIHMNNIRVDDQHAGLTSAISNMIIMISGSVFHFIIGHSLDYLNSINSLATFDNNHLIFKISLSAIPVGLLTALLLLNKKKYFIFK